ncbi:MAG: hypothetical protein K940chlam1_01362 [Candidatus Anoxychlamydiales bacterium]|nr:hypothetical protein [Candidatus Anoxychlamydiales bacterium]NGX36609.1 hypothetical protein [Candidatus Anoxychlamydiales bacterium]
MATPTTLSIDVSANPALVAAANATLSGRAGAADELYARVADVIHHRGYELHDPDQEMRQAVQEKLDSNNFFLKSIGGISALAIFMFSFAFGHSRGSNDILGRLPDAQADKIRDDLHKEALQAQDDLIMGL